MTFIEIIKCHSIVHKPTISEFKTQNLYPLDEYTLDGYKLDEYTLDEYTLDGYPLDGYPWTKLYKQ